MDGTPRSGRIVCDVRAVPADLAAVDALARLELAFRRAGLVLELRHATTELCELVALAGLEGALAVEAGGQPEEREQPLRVEEERQLADPAVPELEHL